MTPARHGALAAFLAGCLLAAPAGAASPSPAGVAAEEQLNELRTEAPDLDPGVLQLALAAHASATKADLLERPELLTVIDYSLPSTEPRLWVFDLERSKLLYHVLVAHGRNTGENHAVDFSNVHGSKQSSLGLFVTAGTYMGGNGYSLYLHGLEEGINHNAFDRLIVIHGAWYVTEGFAEQHGRIGRSWGCPALPPDVSREIIDQIKDGTALFVYYPDEEWLGSSEFLPEGTDGGLPPSE